MALDILQQLIGAGSACVIIYHAEPAINRMSKCTQPLIKMAFVLMLLGAIAMLWRVIIGNVPDCESLLLYCATALLLSVDRRKCDLKRGINQNAVITKL